MKNFVPARPNHFSNRIRFLLTILTITLVFANIPLSPTFAETTSDPSIQVYDMIAEAKQTVWGEYPTVRDPWPVHESAGDLNDLDLPSRSNAQQPIEPELPVKDVAITSESVPEAVVTPPPVAEPPLAPAPANDWLSEFVRLTNVARDKNGLAPLSLNSELCQAADLRAAELPASPSPHLRPDGSAFYTVLSDINLSASYCGENYAIDPTQSATAEQIVNAWLNSPTHRKNILNSVYTGIAFSKVIINGNVYYEQLFIG